MDIVQEEVLEAVLNDESAGAGNFIYRIHAASPRSEQVPLIFIDKPVLDPAGRAHTELTVGQVAEISDHIATAYARLGVRAKEPVALYFNDTIEYFLHFVALTSMGAFPVFINGSLDPDIVVPFTLSTRARFLITEQDRLDILQPAFDKVAEAPDLVALPHLKELAGGTRPSRFRHHRDDAILLAHTSGTTGIPKAVIFTHESMFHGVRQQIRKQRGRSILSILPHSHGAALSLLMLSLTRGAAVHIQTDKDPARILESISRLRPDAVAAFPKVFVDLCRQDLDAYDLGSVRYWIATGDANHEPHIRKLIAQGHHVRDGERRPGSCFVDNLGSSEFAFAMFRNIHSPDTGSYDRCIGRPFPWVQAAVLDDDGTILPPNKVGKLGVISNSVTKGYWNNSNLTEQNRLNGYWLTGDLVYRTEDGTYYHVDRVTDWIDTPKGPLYSCQCEEWLLKGIPDIFEISVVGREGSDGRTRPMAIVELANEARAEDLGGLLDEMNALIRLRGWPELEGITLQPAHHYTGVTGKKLKRQLRVAAL
jgi:long-chain acyl-CoA synthetase